MSNGPTQKYFYEMDNGMKTRVTLQPETVASIIGTDANTPPEGPKTAGIPTAKVSLNDNEIGIRPRFVRCKWATVASGSGYTIGGQVKITILDPANFLIFTEGATANYIGGTVTVEKQVAEQVV